MKPVEILFWGKAALAGAGMDFVPVPAIGEALS